MLCERHHPVLLKADLLLASFIVPLESSELKLLLGKTIMRSVLFLRQTILQP